MVPSSIFSNVVRVDNNTSDTHAENEGTSPSLGGVHLDEKVYRMNAAQNDNYQAKYHFGRS